MTFQFPETWRWNLAENPEMALLSVVTGTFNEEGNVTDLYERVCRTFADELPGYKEYEQQVRYRLTPGVW